MCASHSDQAIGIFDSGLGGLTVMREVIQKLPNERIVYLADTAHVPYGNRSVEAVRTLALAACEKLAPRALKALVVACNTVSACALDHLTAHLPFPVLGVIDPGVQAALSASQSGRIGVLATPRTVSSRCYQSKLLAANPRAQVTAVACPLFVPLVEEQLWEHAAAHAVAQDYLAPLRAAKVDTILLGCTHYPLLQTLLEKEMPESTIVNSAEACAQSVAEALKTHELHAQSLTNSHSFLVTDDAERFKSLGEAFLGHPIASVSAV